jgi:CRISPR-associated protein Cas2
MLVMILEAVPEVAKGELSRWLTPIGSGVFIGRVSADVRELLWQATVEKAAEGRVVQAWATRGEPGYSMRVHGHRDAKVVIVEGVPLLSVQDAAWREAVVRFKLDQPLENAEGDT